MTGQRGEDLDLEVEVESQIVEAEIMTNIEIQVQVEKGGLEADQILIGDRKNGVDQDLDLVLQM